MLEKAFFSIPSCRKFDRNFKNINNNNNIDKKIKYSRNTNFKNLSPLISSKKNKLAFENKSSSFKAERSQSPHLNKNLISFYKKENFSSLLAIRHSNKKPYLSASNQQIDLDAKIELNKEFNFIKNKITNEKNFTINFKRNNSNDINRSNNNLIDDSIQERNNKTLKNLEILNYSETKAEYENDSSTILGVNMLSSNKLSLSDIKNYLKENKNNKNNKNNNNNKSNIAKNKNNKCDYFIVYNLKRKSNYLTNNNLYKHVKKRSHSFSSFDKYENPRYKLSKLINKPENDIALINACYEAESPRNKESSIEFDFKNLYDLNAERKNSNNYNNRNILFEAFADAKANASENTHSKTFNIKFSNNYIQDKVFMNTNSNTGSSNQITSGNTNTITSSNNYNNNNIEEKNFASKLKSLNNIFLKIIESNNNNFDNELNKNRNKTTEKINDFNFNLLQSKNDSNTIDRSNNTFLQDRLSSNQKSTLFDDKILFSSNTINNDFTKKISRFSNISNQAKIKLNEINSMTERLKSIGNKEKKAEDLFKNKKLFEEAKKSDTDEALHKRNILFINCFYHITFSVNFKLKTNEIMGILNTQKKDNMISENQRGGNFLEKLNERKKEILNTLGPVKKGEKNLTEDKFRNVARSDFSENGFAKTKNTYMIDKMKLRILK